MRTNELHAHAKQVQRSSGRSSVAAAAYRSASCLVDERTGDIHDYTKKQGIEHTRIYTPDNAPEWAQDRAQLWNACEAKENRSNSCTAHELEVAFPHEFNSMQRREAGDAIAREIMGRYGVAVDIAYHKPTGRADERNHHAHIMFTSRAFDDTTKDGWSKTKFRDLSKDALRDDRGQLMRDDNDKVLTRGAVEIASLREFSANQMNRIAERENLNVRTEHLSFEARGIDREPTEHLGPNAHEMEQRGENSRIGDENRELQDRNSERAENHRQAAELKMQVEREKARFEWWADRKRDEQAHVQQLASLDLSQKQDRQRARLETELENTYGQHKATIKAELGTIDRRLETKGLRGFVRDVFGRTRSDRASRDDLDKTLGSIARRENEQRQGLEKRLELAQQQEQARQQRNRDHLEKGIETARQRREDEGWQSKRPQKSPQKTQERSKWWDRADDTQKGLKPSRERQEAAEREKRDWWASTSTDHSPEEAEWLKNNWGNAANDNKRDANDYWTKGRDRDDGGKERTPFAPSPNTPGNGGKPGGGDGSGGSGGGSV